MCNLVWQASVCVHYNFKFPGHIFVVQFFDCKYSENVMLAKMYPCLYHMCFLALKLMTVD